MPTDRASTIRIAAVWVLIGAPWLIAAGFAWLLVAGA